MDYIRSASAAGSSGRRRFAWASAAASTVTVMTDASAVAPAHSLFDPLAARYLERPDVDIGPMFGSEGLRVRGKVFAFVGHRGSMVVKLPAPRVDELIADATAERMEIGGRALREWLIVDPSRGQLWEPLVDEAFAYVDDLTP